MSSISVNTTPGNPIIVTPPSGIVDGQPLIIGVATDSDSGVTFTYPLGFVSSLGWPITLSSPGSDGGIYGVSSKVALSEAGNYSISAGGPTATAFVLALTGIDAVGLLNRSSVGSNGTLANFPVTQTANSYLTPTDQICTQVFIQYTDNHTGGTIVHTPPSGFTLLADGSDGTFFQFAVSIKTGVPAGAVGNLSGSANGTGQAGWCVASFAFQEAGGPATPGIQGKQSGHIYQVGIDLQEIKNIVLGKSLGGGPAPTPPSYRPQIRNTTPFDDNYTNFDYYGTVTQTIGASPGIVPKLTAPNRFITNPYYYEPDFNFNQVQTNPAKGGAAPPVKGVYNHIFTNLQFNDTQFDFINSVSQTGKRTGAMVGFPRKSIRNPSDIAIQIQNELNYWDRFYKAQSSKPAQGGSSPQPGTGALLLGGFIGVHVGVGRL